jgi:uncharacterized alkaline shock family protein YloU
MFTHENKKDEQVNMQKETIETIPVSTRITLPMRRAINGVLQINAHINVADYLRDLIRKDLESRGVKVEEAEPT